MAAYRARRWGRASPPRLPFLDCADSQALSARFTIVALAVALLAVGCRGGAMTEYRFSKDTESLTSLAAEGSLLADGVVNEGTTSAFVLTHAQDLASDSEKLASVVESTDPEAGLARKTRRLALLARRAAAQLRRLADHPSDVEVAAEVHAALQDVVNGAEKLEKSA